MISVILYGRNDSYGYNLHKRAAISLNCIAHVLDHPDDEIIFVDYNSPDDTPTFIEAIQDTLTAKAKSLIRILRVRPEVHERFANRTHLVALEPISRNVAARRSNPANRWLLSTNTDMIFVTVPEDRSLSRIAAALPDGCYHAPRFELPEGLWESFDRMDPAGAVGDLREWGRRFHLNDVVYINDTVIYDGPGDFQLVLRDDVFAIDAFHEGMLLGWHVDSNFARRMKLLRGEVKSVFPAVYGYHCDHTRQATLMHGRNRVENDIRRFFFEVHRPNLPEQKDGWGLAHEEVEEIKLMTSSASRTYVRALDKIFPGRNRLVTELHHTSKKRDDLSYDPEHVLPFLCDLISSSPRHWNVAYVGCRNRMFELFCQAYEAMGFTGQVSIPEKFSWLVASGHQSGMVIRATVEQCLKSADQFIFEFGLGSADQGQGSLARREEQTRREQGADDERLTATTQVFEAMVKAERDGRRRDGGRSRKVLAVNAVYNPFEDLIRQNIDFTHTPYSTRVTHGQVLGEIEAGV